VKIRTLVPAAMAGLLLLSGCAAEEATPAADADTAPECVATVSDSSLVEPGVLNLGTNATLPPLSYADADGVLMGQRIDMGEAIAERLCLTVKWTNAQATTLLPSMEAGRIDAIDIGYFVTDERQLVMRMIPTERMGISISVQKGNPDDISEVEDLAGKSVGTSAGSFEEKTLQTMSADLVAQGLEPINIQSFNEYNIVFQSLSSGQLDAAATTSPVSTYYADKGGFDAAIEGLQLTDTSITVGPANAELADAIVAALDAMKEDGTYDDMLAEYNLEPVDTFQVLYTGS
jgi:polar amino acid transport system substrate-binding protein